MRGLVTLKLTTAFGPGREGSDSPDWLTVLARHRASPGIVFAQPEGIKRLADRLTPKFSAAHSSFVGLDSRRSQ
jgi:hypothetical protein